MICSSLATRQLTHGCPRSPVIWRTSNKGEPAGVVCHCGVTGPWATSTVGLTTTLDTGPTPQQRTLSHERAGPEQKLAFHTCACYAGLILAELDPEDQQPAQRPSLAQSLQRDRSERSVAAVSARSSQLDLASPCTASQGCSVHCCECCHGHSCRYSSPKSEYACAVSLGWRKTRETPRDVGLNV